MIRQTTNSFLYEGRQECGRNDKRLKVSLISGSRLTMKESCRGVERREQGCGVRLKRGGASAGDC